MQRSVVNEDDKRSRVGLERSRVILNLIQELPPNVELVAVSKFHPVEAIQEAYEAGLRVFAESRPQELHSKVPAMRKYLASKGLQDDIRWHFIGHLQTNKLKFVLPYAELVQSVDSLRLLEAIDGWGHANGRVVNVLLEQHIASEESKQGFSADEIMGILTGRKYDNIRFCGLMGMATFTDDESLIRADFAKIIALNDALQPLIDRYPNLTHDFSHLSFGMSGDYRIAVEMGSNMVRLGTIIFGERQY